MEAGGYVLDCSKMFAFYSTGRVIHAFSYLLNDKVKRACAAEPSPQHVTGLESVHESDAETYSYIDV